MKSTLFLNIIFAILFVIGINAQNVTLSNEEDMKNYLSVENIERDIAYNGGRLLDVYYDKQDTMTPKPVVIHIYGGSWVSGSKIQYTKFGSLLESEGYVAVLPNYILFPNGSIEDMVEDVYNAIQWTYNNISKYGGNPNLISLSAHSAGAHVSALTIVKAALNLPNNNVTLQNLPQLDKVVLMNGPYVFDQEFLYYTLQGTTDTSNTTATSDKQQQAILQKLMLTYYGNAEISPIEILKEYEDNSIYNNFNVNKFVFFYTSLDNVVPESSSKNLIAQINRTSNVQYEYVYIEGIEHASLVRGVRGGDVEYENMYIELLRK
ncbi:alpha/beta-hydrolase [Piromyces finnis]|uniref:Alpha/beta-hydrolase n=1 Tax=Piromyces finnis TaxID=1754191 RepID=A0A1Y1VIN3_9FUNG|nr:alpha/beta-hydrolase [Piromyces finnis]|eukprot:ORX57266.1 alpha/beta-hydrolase [Piromyces finnis]